MADQTPEKSLEIKWNTATVIDPDGTVCVVKGPCFAFDDFDRSGNISPLKIARYFQWGRTEAYYNCADFIIRQFMLATSTRIFMTVAEYHISKSMYTNALRWKRQGGFETALFSTKLHSAGRSTLNMFSKIELVERKEELARLNFKMTVVDSATRKSSPLPEAFKTKLSKQKNTEKILGKFVPNERPYGAFSYSTTIRPSDTDMNGHTNQAIYIQFCFDTATAASMLGNIFKNYKGDLALYKVKTMYMWYAGESMMGDILKCFCWEDDSDSSTIHFQIEMKGRTIYHNSVVFYPQEVFAKL